MGRRAAEANSKSTMVLRERPLTADQRSVLHQRAVYEGDPQHKRNPGDFNLTPPAAPVSDKTLCDEVSLFRRAEAAELLRQAIDGGLVGKDGAAAGIPKRMWVVRHDGRVFEARETGDARYHGYPIRRVEPLYDQVVDAWKRLHG